MSGMFCICDVSPKGDDVPTNPVATHKFQALTTTKHHDENPLSLYIGYLYGVSRLYNAGGYIHSKTRDWKIPEYNLTGKGERKLHLFIAMLMDGLLSYKTYEFDTPIQAQDNEVDEDNDEIVINRSLIDRYVKDTQSL